MDLLSDEYSALAGTREGVVNYEGFHFKKMDPIPQKLIQLETPNRQPIMADKITPPILTQDDDDGGGDGGLRTISYIDKTNYLLSTSGYTASDAASSTGTSPIGTLGPEIISDLRTFARTVAQDSYEGEINISISYVTDLTGNERSFIDLSITAAINNIQSMLRSNGVNNVINVATAVGTKEQVNNTSTRIDRDE